MLLVFMSTTQLPNAPLAAQRNNQYGQTNVPEKADFVATSDRLNATSAGRNIQESVQDGPVAAWGNNEYGQTNVPEKADFVAIAVGWRHSVALRKDGSLSAWGYNKDGQTNVPAGNDFVAIAAAGSTACAPEG